MLALSNLSEVYMRLGRLKDAEYASIELLACARREGSDENHIRAVGRLAMAALLLDQRSWWNDLREQLEEAVEMARRIRLRYWVVQNLETLGCFAISVGDTPAGFNWLQMALNAIDKSLNEAEFFRARIYCGISDCMMKIGKPQRAVEYADLAVLTASKARSPHLLAISKLSVARVHRFVGDTSEALQYATEVRVRARRDGWKLEELAAEKLLHETYYSVARFGEALEAILRALSLAEELGLHEDLAHLLLKAAQICRDLGRPMQAERYLQRAADLASISDQSEVMAQAQLALATAGLEIPSRNSLPSSQKDN